MSKQKIVTTQEPSDLIQPFLIGGYQRSVRHSLLSTPPKPQFNKFTNTTDALRFLIKSPYRLPNQADRIEPLI